MNPKDLIKFFEELPKLRLTVQIESAKQTLHENIRKHFARPDNDGFYPPKTDEILNWMKTRQRNEIAQLERKLRKLEGDKKFNDKVSSNENITPDMIVKAKNYPIENLVEVNKQGFAKCIWHKEKTPSMFCKKNFANCFSCGKNGDTIAVLMERDSLTFKEAVLKLQ